MRVRSTPKFIRVRAIFKSSARRHCLVKGESPVRIFLGLLIFAQVVLSCAEIGETLGEGFFAFGNGLENVDAALVMFLGLGKTPGGPVGKASGGVDQAGVDVFVAKHFGGQLDRLVVVLNRLKEFALFLKSQAFLEGGLNRLAQNRPAAPSGQGRRLRESKDSSRS